jgi:hypothetical protein
MICSAQEEPPQPRKFNVEESGKIWYCKNRKNKLKRLPGRAPNYKKRISRIHNTAYDGVSPSDKARKAGEAAGQPRAHDGRGLARLRHADRRQAQRGNQVALHQGR